MKGQQGVVHVQRIKRSGAHFIYLTKEIVEELQLQPQQAVKLEKGHDGIYNIITDFLASQPTPPTQFA